MNVLWGIGGMVFVLAVAVLFSVDRRKIRIRTVSLALATQVLFGFLVLYVPAGRTALEAASQAVQAVIDSSRAGIDFLFGPVLPEEGSVFAFQVLPVIVFFAALTSVLYYLNILQWVVKVVGGGLAKLLGTTTPESMNAAANIFVGQTEAPLVIRPYVPGMTRSELFAVMCGGLATVAGSVLVGYSLLGAPLEYLIAAAFMAAPAALLMAKLLVPAGALEDPAPAAAADGAVVTGRGGNPGSDTNSAARDGGSTAESKPVTREPAGAVPAPQGGGERGESRGDRSERGESRGGGSERSDSSGPVRRWLTRGARRGATAHAAAELARRQNVQAASAHDEGLGAAEDQGHVAGTDAEGETEEEPANVIDAAARGASDGLSLALNVGAMLIAFISLIALINVLLGVVGGLFGNEDLTLQQIFGYVFSPVMFAVGVPWSEALDAGSFLGQKLVLNEFVAFSDFAPQIDDYSAKTQAVVTFALTGFANFGSLAILLGGLGGIAPTRRGDIARLGLRAVLGGTLANLMSAAIAGMLIG